VGAAAVAAAADRLLAALRPSVGLDWNDRGTGRTAAEAAPDGPTRPSHGEVTALVGDVIEALERALYQLGIGLAGAARAAGGTDAAGPADRAAMRLQVNSESRGGD
jgi:hypothetical protein